MGKIIGSFEETDPVLHSKREAIYNKAKKIIRKDKEWEEHRDLCFKAGICPNCGSRLVVKDRDRRCKCRYVYQWVYINDRWYQTEEGVTIK